MLLNLVASALICYKRVNFIFLSYCCFMNILTLRNDRDLKLVVSVSVSVCFKGSQIMVLSDEWGQNLSGICVLVFFTSG